MIQTGGNLFIAGCPSDISAQCVAIYRISGTPRFLIGATDRLREILDFATAGAGWGSQEIYFEVIAGNKAPGVFHNFATVSYSATRGINVQVKNFDESDSETLNPELTDGQYLARVDREGIRHRMKFVFPTDDNV